MQETENLVTNSASAVSVSPSSEAASAPAAELPSAAAGVPENKAPQHYHKNPGAKSRIKQLLSDMKALRSECEELRLEAKAVLAKASEKIEQLKGEVLAARQEVNDLQAREETRLFDEEERRKGAAQREADYRQNCIGVLIGAAHAEDLYKKWPDFNTRIRRFDTPECTRLLTEILTFPKEVIGRMAYVIASNRPAMEKLAQLSNELPWACVRWLVKISMDFEGDVRVKQIQERLMAWK